MSQPITFEGLYGVDGIETVIAHIARSPGSPLLLPTELKHRAFGADAAAIQAIFTWARQPGQRELVTYITQPSLVTAGLQNLAETDHGLVGLLLARQLYGRDRETPLPMPTDRMKLRLAQSEDAGNVIHGARIFLLCKDEGERIKHRTPLYYPSTDSNAGLLMEHEFRPLFQKLLRRIFATIKLSVSRDPRLESANETISKIVHELFENTHRWARTDATNESLPWSIRGIRAEVHRAPVNDFKKYMGDATPLRNYLSNDIFGAFTTHVRVAEISIFDSGPGLASRKLERSLTAEDTIKQEYEAVKDRFAVHRTSSTATHRGKGLHEVLRLLSQHSGFLRIRTGRLSLFRNFISDPYENDARTRRQSAGNASVDLRQEPYLHDWNGGTTLTMHAPASGVLISLLFPLVEGLQG